MNRLKHFLLNGYTSYENMEGGGSESSNIPNELLVDCKNFYQTESEAHGGITDVVVLGFGLMGKPAVANFASMGLRVHVFDNNPYMTTKWAHNEIQTINRDIDTSNIFAYKERLSNETFRYTQTSLTFGGDIVLIDVLGLPRHSPVHKPTLMITIRKNFANTYNKPNTILLTNELNEHISKQMLRDPKIMHGRFLLPIMDIPYVEVFHNNLNDPPPEIKKVIGWLLSLDFILLGGATYGRQRKALYTNHYELVQNFYRTIKRLKNPRISPKERNSLNLILNIKRHEVKTKVHYLFQPVQWYTKKSLQAFIRKYNIDLEIANQTGIIPDEFLCPITREIMIDPVYLKTNPLKPGHGSGDFHTFERDALTKWLESNDNCPLCRVSLRDTTMTINQTLIDKIKQWIQQTFLRATTSPSMASIHEEDDDLKLLESLEINYEGTVSPGSIENRLSALEEELFYKRCTDILKRYSNKNRIKILMKYIDDTIDNQIPKELSECEEKELKLHQEAEKKKEQEKQKLEQQKIQRYLEQANSELINRTTVLSSSTPISSPIYNNLLIHNKGPRRWSRDLYGLVLKTSQSPKGIIKRIEAMENYLNINNTSTAPKSSNIRLIDIEKTYKLQNMHEFI